MQTTSTESGLAGFSIGAGATIILHKVTNLRGEQNILESLAIDGDSPVCQASQTLSLQRCVASHLADVTDIIEQRLSREQVADEVCLPPDICQVSIT